jgi:hypothetical protein
MLAFPDAIVMLSASTLGGLLGGQGAVGAVAKQMHDRKQTKDRAAASDELSSADFSGHKRAQVIAYGDITAARLETGKMQNKVIFETATGPRHLRYAKKLWPAEEASTFLSAHLGDRYAPAS